MESVPFLYGQVCCFSGHRNLPKEKMANIIKRLDEEIEKLIAQDITTFIVGGALGFDYLATIAVIKKREANENIRLIYALPCPSYNKKWLPEAQLLYKELFQTGADDVIYVSEKYSHDCFKKRNYFMIQNSQYCICALLHNRTRTGTGQTVRMAKEKGLTVINLLDDDSQ